MEFNELLSSFADQYAVEGLDVEDGVAVLSVDGTEITFREDGAGDALVLTAEIGEMPPDSQGVFAGLALRSNFASLGETALSLDAETDDLFATTSLPLALADPDALSRAVEALVDTAEEWRRNATAFLDVDEEAALAEEDDEDANPLSGSSDFIRV